MTAGVFLVFNFFWLWQFDASVIDTGWKDDLSTGFAKALLNFIDKIIEIWSGRENNYHERGKISGAAIEYKDVGTQRNVSKKILLLAWIQMQLNEGLNVIVQFF